MAANLMGLLMKQRYVDFERLLANLVFTLAIKI